ncbi:CGNR zinc finger domain-containing protein [Streptomyces sp. NPDC055966]|uniref:CGNR zinc finger domain-containing protein n=1 Tax=Streptomyces sp. NPDC055966 TaxID=3345669 RepID=UPI0035DA8424
MRYVDYIGNLTRIAVEIVNGDDPSELRREMFRQHRIAEPDTTHLAQLLPALRAAVEAASQAGPIGPVNALLEQHPPLIRVDDHDGEGSPHLHFAPNAADAVSWLGRSCAAALAHVVCGDPAVTIGRCHATGCTRFYVDDSRNRTRRFCSNACASRTTVAAYRARHRATS